MATLRAMTGVLALSVLLFSSPRGAWADYIIDDFGDVEVGTTQSVVYTTAAGSSVFDEDDGLSNVIGGSRDLDAWVRISSGGSDNVTATVDENTGRFSLSVTAGTDGAARLTWDGNDDSGSTSTQGLRTGGVGIDLTQSGANNGIRVQLGSVDEAWSMSMYFWGGGGGASTIIGADDDGKASWR